jgi:putative hydrolase of the HAD superfamily
MPHPFAFFLAKGWEPSNLKIRNHSVSELAAIVHNRQRRLFHDTRRPPGGNLALRAVVFDYGMVLTESPDPKAKTELLRITGLSAARLDSFYWPYRAAYDAGQLTGLEFWQKLVSEAGLKLSQSAVEELNLWDARMWTTQNVAMLAWQQQLHQRGLLTAILSNMGDNVLDNMKREFDWLPRLDVLVWSYQLHLTKPDPAIYRYMLKKLGTQPEETLFIDDMPRNIEAAQALGIKGLVFTGIQQLRQDLIAQGYDQALPLPA